MAGKCEKSKFKGTIPDETWTCGIRRMPCINQKESKKKIIIIIKPV